MANGGRLRFVRDAEELRALLRAFGGQKPPRPERRRARRALGRLAEWASALGAAVALWLLVFGGESDERLVRAHVDVANLPADFVLRSLSPAELAVVVSGPRRDLFFLHGSDVAVTVDALFAQLGRRTFDVPPQSVRVPPGVTVRSIAPERVTFELERSPSR